MLSKGGACGFDSFKKGVKLTLPKEGEFLMS